MRRLKLDPIRDLGKFPSPKFFVVCKWRADATYTTADVLSRVFQRLTAASRWCENNSYGGYGVIILDATHVTGLNLPEKS